LFISQQEPDVQVFLRQQGWLGPPQTAQMPLSQISEALPQVPSAQQGWPAAPQVLQMPLSQARVTEEHWFPAQQTFPEAPQLWHVPETQRAPGVHWPPMLPPRQHGCPMPPQALQIPAAQTNPSSQRSPVQQAWPLVPHAAQLFLLAQTLSSPQVAPTGLQMLRAPDSPLSQQPVLQAFPLQQGWKSPPHPAHEWEARHRSPSVQVLPTATQVCFLVSQHPVLQLSLAQQGCPGAPQALHRAAEQTVPA
jgi:hypothetical protein